MKKILSITTLLFAILLSFNTLAISAKNINITGKVIDNDSGEALEFATVSLFNLPDSTLVTGVITDSNGAFTLQVSEGKYFISVQFVGYKTKTININAKNNDVNLGKIYLQEDSKLLQEVEVIGEKSTMTMSLDKRVFNVGKDIASTAGNAIEVLENIPSVTVDVEGNVSLRGDDGVQILVDGKASGLVGLSTQDALRSLQADMIERIEVVTNPSARYDAEGTAGIINIVLKKEKRKGVNGSIDVLGGFPFEWGKAQPQPFPFQAGIGASINYRLRRFNLFASYNYNYRDDISDGYTKTEYFNGGIPYNPDIENHSDASQISEQTTERGRHSQGHNIRGGFDFYISDNDILSFSALYNNGTGHNTPTVTYIDDFPFEGIKQFKKRSEDWHNSRPTNEFTLDYDKYFNTKDNYLKTSLRYFQNENREWSDIYDRHYASQEDMDNDIVIDTSVIRQYTDVIEKHRRFQGMVDFAYHIGLHNIEAGAKYTNAMPSNDAIVMQSDTLYTAYCHEFDYNQQVAALYASYGTEFGLFSFLAGARYEYTYTMANYKNQIDGKHTQSYHDIFPSGHINYKITEQNQLQVSYTRRIRRPGYWQMAPYRSFNDDRNFRVGNPALRPIYTDSYEFSFLKFWEGGNLNLTGYYRHRTDVIRHFTEVEGDVSVSMPHNFGISDNYGVEVVGSVKVFDWWNINGNVNFFKSCAVGDYTSEKTGITTHYTTDSYGLFGRLVMKFDFKKFCNFQFTGHFMGPRTEPLGFRAANYWLDFAASRDVFNGKGTLSLNVRDFFGTRSHGGESWGDNFWKYSKGSWSKTTVTLNFNYRINQQNRQKDRDNNRNDSDEGGDF
ncbi:MAG: TonB-dependent receptor [Bacteroidales bacterium]|nr:TonB-dependent receptor [Bacteroidales bacterium]